MTLNQEQLFEIAECGHKALLIEWLQENGVNYMLTRKGRVVTTLDQINKALQRDGEQEIDFVAPS